MVHFHRLQITLHHITLHHITSHYITLRYNILQSNQIYQNILQYTTRWRIRCATAKIKELEGAAKNHRGLEA